MSSAIADGRLGTALGAARLQHIELAALDGEFEILHVAVVPLELIGDIDELSVDAGREIFEVGDLLRRTDPGDDVFALRVAQILAEQLVLAGVRIARECDAGSRIVAHVPENHRDDANRRSPIVRNLVEAAIIDRALRVPRIEDGFDRER